MEQLSSAISEIFFTLSPFMRGAVAFVFAYLEGLPIVGSALPGGTIALLVGSLSAQGFISPILAVSLIAVGSFLGDMTGFLIGKRFHHTKLLQRLVAQERHQKSWDIFDRHLALIVIFGKLIPVVRSTPSFFAGARKVKTGRYMLLSAAGSVLWAVAGIYGGNILARTVGAYAIPIIIGILVVTGFVAVFAKAHKHRTQRA